MTKSVEENHLRNDTANREAEVATSKAQTEQKNNKTSDLHV